MSTRSRAWHNTYVLDLANEKDPELLRQAALLLESENKRLVEKIAALTRELLELKGAAPEALQLKLLELQEQLAARNRALFGKSSEKQRHDKPAGAAPAQEPKQPQRGHGPREQPALPIVPVPHVLDAADCCCPTCGGTLQEWPGQFEESEEIDIVERVFVLKKHRQQKYRCACNARIETAPGPQKLFPGARYSIDFAVDVAVQKYCDHLPLERLRRIFERQGLIIDTQTLWDQVNALARVLEPLNAQIRQHVLRSPVVGADETPWELLRAKRQPEGDAGRWWAWTLCCLDAVLYEIRRDRSAASAAGLLDGYQGIVVVDGYGSYASLAKKTSGIRFVNCWAHVRRKFEKAMQSAQDSSGEMLVLLAKLYAVEDLAPGTDDASLARRSALRDERSRPLVAEIRKWLDARYPTTLPQSGLGKAIAYARNLWAGLTQFLDDPRIPIDNNFTERGIRGLAVGRKNHYGSRSRRGTVVAAQFYSLIETCKLNGVEPKAYLGAAARSLRGGATSYPLPHEVAASATAPPAQGATPRAQAPPAPAP